MSAQLEDGYTRIANEIVEKLCTLKITNYESRFLWALFRKTYGFHKKEDRISLSQFALLTRIESNHIARTKKKLLEKNIIFQKDGKIGIQTDTKTWVVPNEVVPNQVVPNEVSGSTQTGSQVVPKQVHTKETITKETKQKKERLTSADSFFSKIQENPKGLEEKATKYDVREKDILYCVEQAGEWARGNSLTDNTWVWWDGFLNRWISRAIRRHELKRLSDKTEDEPKKAKLSKDDLEALEILARCKVYG